MNVNSRTSKRPNPLLLLLHSIHPCNAGSFIRRFAGILCVLAACGQMLSGCGGPATPSYPTAKLAGAVKAEGQPVEQGRIRFSPTKPDQAPAAEGPIAAGRYSVENSPVGNVVVTFIGTKKTGRVVELDGQKSEESVSVIPAKYSRGLPVTVDADGNRDFDLTSK